MEIRDLLEKLEDIIGEMSEKELRASLYDYARKLPEEARSHFLLGLLESDEEFDQEKIDRGMLWASDWFDDVEKGKKKVYYIQDKELNDWDYSYDRDDEFEGIEDREDVLIEFARVLGIIERMVKVGQFEDVDELLERLFQLEMRAPIIWKYDDSEIDEYYVNVDDLFDVLEDDADYYGRLWLYTIVQVSAIPNFTRLFEAMKKRKMTDIDVIQTVGPNEVKAAEFIDEWIAFLAKTKEDGAYILLVEACRAYKSMYFIGENLAEFGQTHPLLFLDVLSKKISIEYVEAEFDAVDLKTRVHQLSIEQLEDIKNIVELAEDFISEELKIGAEVMEVGFEISNRMNNVSKVAHFRKQAFRYHSSIVNYLRLRPYLGEDELLLYKDIWAKSKKAGFRSFSVLQNTSGLAQNTLDENQLEAQLFFTEQFAAFLNVCKESKASLGWSSSILGYGVPLFLLLLNKNSESSRAMKWMEKYVVEHLIDSKRDRDYFSETFNQFKDSINLSKELEAEIMEWLEKRISDRTAALLDNKHRNAYYRATELIIAYGEVLESRGENGARARIAEKYRKKYNNFNRFTRELKERTELCRNKKDFKKG